MTRVPRIWIVTCVLVLGAYVLGRFSGSTAPDAVVRDQTVSAAPNKEAQFPESTATLRDRNEPLHEVNSRPLDSDPAMMDPYDDDTAAAADADVLINALTRDRISSLSYEVVANTNIATVAYLEGITCDQASCDLALQFFNTANMSSNTAAFMKEMNARFLEQSTTKDIQLYLSSIRPGKNGAGEAKLVTGPRKQPTLAGKIFVVVGSDSED